MGAITLTVRSVNNINLTAYSGIFVVENMSGLQDNQNPTNAITITEAGDTGTVMSAWALNGNFAENQVLYWSVETATELGATVRRVRIYNNITRTNVLAEGTATIANNNNGTVFFTQANESGISGSVLVTIGGSLTNDNDSGNTLTLTGVLAATDLQLNGVTQWMQQEGREHLIKYTCDETVAQVQTLINNLYS